MLKTKYRLVRVYDSSFDVTIYHIEKKPWWSPCWFTESRNRDIIAARMKFKVVRAHLGKIVKTVIDNGEIENAIH